MAYFRRGQDAIDRGGMIAADILFALMILIFATTFFGMLGGILAFVVLEGALAAVEIVSAGNDDASGAAIR